MAINVSKVSEGYYTVSVTPPHADEPWTSAEPMRMNRVCEELIARGVHQVDVGDAVNEADREWFRTELKEKLNR